MNPTNKNNLVSILISPFNLINNSEIYDNKSFDYTNSFKIITNSNKNMQEIKYFFFKEILEMNDYEINKNQNNIIFGKINSIWETVGNDNEMNNYSILYYNDDNEFIKNKNKTNNIFLIKEYKKKFQKNKYSKIPYYINSITKLFLPENICPVKIKIENDINYNQIIVDDKESFSSFLKKNNYYDKLPIIFINSDYYKGILHFLQQSQKYENFKNKNSLTKLLIESGEKNNNNNNHFKDKRIIADVVEKSNFYSLNDTIEIIKNIKSEIKGNYKQIINNWITTIFEILSEFFLFVLNIRLCYDKCSLCNSPILYINDINKNKNEIKTNKNEKNHIILFKKSLITCNNIFKVISQNFKASSIKELTKYYLKKCFDDSEKPKIPANPPRKILINLLI